MEFMSIFRKGLMKKTLPNATESKELLQMLQGEGYFRSPRGLGEISKALKTKGYPTKNDILAKELIIAVRSGLLERGTYSNQWKYKDKPESKRGSGRTGQKVLDHELIRRLGDNFKIEMSDLSIVYGASGTCTAFLLRKILEKLIYLTFAKQGMEKKIEDPQSHGYLLGLEAMVTVAAKEKVGGTPFLLPRTAKEIRGLKFLGDAAAHNPLINIDMRTIEPQMPFIITAYKELSRLL